MSEIQEPKPKKPAFNAVEALDKIRQYRDRVVEINKSFANIHYGLQQYNNNSGTRQEPWKRLLETDFRYLETSDNYFYINAIGDFSRMYRYLKNRYEAEVLNSEPLTNNS